MLYKEVSELYTSRFVFVVRAYATVFRLSIAVMSVTLCCVYCG